MITARTIEKYIAMRSDGTENSGIILSAKRIIRPLITKENSPSVSRLIGIEISINTGLIVWLITANTRAVRSAIQAVLKDTANDPKARGTPTLVI